MKFHHLYLLQSVEPRAFRSLGLRSEAITKQGANLSFSYAANIAFENTFFSAARGFIKQKKSTAERAERALFSALTTQQIAILLWL